jgi:hypothetical protein
MVPVLEIWPSTVTALPACLITSFGTSPSPVSALQTAVLLTAAAVASLTMEEIPPLLAPAADEYAHVRYGQGNWINIQGSELVHRDTGRVPRSQCI